VHAFYADSRSEPWYPLRVLAPVGTSHAARLNRSGVGVEFGLAMNLFLLLLITIFFGRPRTTSRSPQKVEFMCSVAYP